MEDEAVVAVAARLAVDPSPAFEHVGAGAAREAVVARAVPEFVGGGVAGDGVVARSADGVLDQRARVAVVLQRVKMLPRAKLPLPREARCTSEKVE